MGGTRVNASAGEVDHAVVEDREDAVAGGEQSAAAAPGVGLGVVDVNAVVDAVLGGAGAGEGLAAHDVELAVREDGLSCAAARLREWGLERPLVGLRIVHLHVRVAVRDGIAVAAAGAAPAEDVEALTVGA